MKKLAVYLIALMLVILNCPAASAEDASPPAADYTSETVFLDPDALHSPYTSWYVWTWGVSSGRWVRGDLSNGLYSFDNVEKNAVFACMYRADDDPAWDSSTMWKQSVNVELDGVNNLFVMTEGETDGKLTGYWSSLKNDVTDPTEPYSTTHSTEDPQKTEPNPPFEPDTDPTGAWLTEPLTQDPTIFPTSPTNPTSPTAFTNPPTTVTPTFRPSTDPTESSSTGGNTVTDKTVSLNLKTASVKCGKIITLRVSNSGNAKPRFFSGNSAVAKVSASGKVSALKKGFAKITVTVGKKTLVFTIKVTSSPKLSKTELTLKKGGCGGYIDIIGKARTVKNNYASTSTAVISAKRTASRLKIIGRKKGKTTLRVRVNGVLLKLRVTVK